ncbi:MAG: zinc ribbon domain-containing protein [Cyanobacteria bacterium MAG CAR2_bin_4]|nr:zinc ribbon domain-containing protein [Cyanobacteria bacterium MAG CAR2_bin_4]
MFSLRGGGSRNDLSVRRWRCSVCGAEHHRDVNAARSILPAGLAERFKGIPAADGGEEVNSTVYRP